MDARVILTEGFKKMTKQKLTRREKNTLAIKKLKQYDQDGTLKLANSRHDVAELLGYQKNSATGYSYVSNLVHRQVLEEKKIMGGTETGKPMYEYRVINDKPIYTTYDKPENPHKGLKGRALGAENLRALKSLNDSGELAQIRTRDELAKAVGYTNKELGRKWAYAQIRKRHTLTEKFLGFEGGMPIYEYTLRRKRTRRSKQPHDIATNVTHARIEDVAEKAEPLTPIISRVVADEKVVVEVNNVKITLEGCNADYVGAIIKTLKEE